MKNKLLLLVCLLTIALSQAQIVNIPDANFKAKLLEADATNQIAKDLLDNFFKIDANDDGEIQESEALQVSVLGLTFSNIENLEGIGAFINLNNLNCSVNDIVTLDLTENINLERLHCEINDLTSLNLAGNTNLKVLSCGYNDLTTLNLNSNVNLIDLSCRNNLIQTLNLENNLNLLEVDCDNNNLVTLNVESNINLEFLKCESNDLTSLLIGVKPNLTSVFCENNELTNVNLNGITNLNYFDCKNNPMSTLDLSNNTALKTLNCNNNELTILDISNNIALEYLHCSNNQLTALNLDVNTNLKHLFCELNELVELDFNANILLEHLSINNNDLSQLDINNNENLSVLNCKSNALTELDLSNNLNLNTLVCSDNLFTLLDVNDNSQLFYLDYRDNPQLEIVYHKNGDAVSSELTTISLFGFNCPNLEYVCTDEYRVEAFAQYFSENEMTVNVNSYCSFMPSGNYNNIEGAITHDFEGNGCTVIANNSLFNKININDGVEEGIAYTNNENEYSFSVGAGNYTITPSFENPSYFNVNPLEASVIFPTEDGLTEIQDFCITPNGIHNDLEIVLASTVPARPGFDAEYLLVYKNKGNQTLSGDVSFTYNEDVLDYISSTEMPTTQTEGVLGWTYVDLLPFESRNVAVTLNVNSPMEIPAINIDDVLNFSATITPVDIDDLPEDNQFSLEQVVIGAYDPNDITCLEGAVLEPSYIGKYLHYLINFENTGNAPAENIVVAMHVDTTLYNLNSLELLNSSHASEIRINGNKVEFIFESIFLEALGKGHLVFKMKSQEALQVGDTVTQHAEIFFDFNFPVITNTASTTFAVLSTPEFTANTTIAVYPNPFNEVLTIKAKDIIRDVEIYDVQGRVVFSEKINSTEAVLNIPEQTQGVYFVKMTTDQGIEIEKIIKK